MKIPTDQRSDWIVVTAEALPVAAAMAWVVQQHCGAVVSFCGTVRDSSEGRPGVVSLEYEAYEAHAVGRMEEVARLARQHVPRVGRIALLHRVGLLQLSEISVVVAVSTPHRAEAFRTARFCIDAVKTTVPIWKRETWAGGSHWSTTSGLIAEASELPVP